MKKTIFYYKSVDSDQNNFPYECSLDFKDFNNNLQLLIFRNSEQILKIEIIKGLINNLKFSNNNLTIEFIYFKEFIKIKFLKYDDYNLIKNQINYN